jgi:hypothetical protein
VTEHVISLTHFLVMCFNKAELKFGFNIQKNVCCFCDRTRYKFNTFLVMCFNKVELKIAFEYGLKNLD